MYSSDHPVFVEETSLSTPLCGVSRPGHFRGVATVVAKLFNIVQPDFAVFGQKDAQQARIIVQMVKNLNFPVKIVLAPTVREPDGLAMSSRNAYLSKEERTRAACLYNALQLAKNLAAEKTRDTTAIQRQMRKLINNGSLPVTIDYIVIVDNNTLQPVTRIHSPALVALAVRIGKTRLIDNIVIDV
jgi:pantoate--beta-alanine ligase